MRKVIYCSNSEVLIDWDGTIYHGEEDEDLEPVMIRNESNSDRVPLTREAVEEFSWEPYEDSQRNFCSTVAVPSWCFHVELENLGFNPTMIEYLEYYFSEELEKADKDAEDYLKPLEIEKIQEDFEEWLQKEQEHADFNLKYYGEEDTRTEDDKVYDYMNEVLAFQRGYLLSYTDTEELEKILRNELGGEDGTASV